MAHFAKISDTSQVLSVHVVNNNDILNAEGVEDESIGQAYLEKHSNWPADKWIQTSYNTYGGVHKLGGTPLRGNYAGIGDTWDAVNNIFYNSKPYASWVLNTTTATWHSPIGDAPTLTAEQISQNAAITNFWQYSWNEEGQSWDLVDKLA
jgi:hypothetical protein|tara:strand:- start:2741 stop:3190 length:450 start_codon:yes stop_codon:yes gene_type:complete